MVSLHLYLAEASRAKERTSHQQPVEASTVDSLSSNSLGCSLVRME